MKKKQHISQTATIAQLRVSLVRLVRICDSSKFSLVQLSSETVFYLPSCLYLHYTEAPAHRGLGKLIGCKIPPRSTGSVILEGLSLPRNGGYVGPSLHISHSRLPGRYCIAGLVVSSSQCLVEVPQNRKRSSRHDHSCLLER